MFVGYSRGTSNYPKIILLSDRTNIMCMSDLISIDVKIPRIDSRCSLEKEFTESIHIIHE